MKPITENEYNRQMKRIKAMNVSKKRRLSLKNEKAKYRYKPKLPSTSKLVLLVVILLCFEIVFFAEYVMLNTGDISALYTLIGVPVTLVPTIWGYYSKSKAENSKDGITYDMAMAEFNQNQMNNNSEYATNMNNIHSECIENKDAVG